MVGAARAVAPLQRRLYSGAAMDVGVEISFYPLQAEYLPPIRALIERLGAQSGLRVETNSLSTQLFGEYEQVMRTLTQELRAALLTQSRAVVLMKLIGPLGD
jgi:uncharacterized protein YqgV (UPF0045/DUF77 family)